MTRRKTASSHALQETIFPSLRGHCAEFANRSFLRTCMKLPSL